MSPAESLHVGHSATAAEMPPVTDAARRTAAIPTGEASTRAPDTWAGIATAYSTYTSPLRPCQEDVDVFARAAYDWRRSHPHGPMYTLLLGATPDIAVMTLPPDATLIGMDSSLEVIKAIWPGNVLARRGAVCGNWMSLPLRRHVCDFVIGDGSLNAFRYPDALRVAAAAIREALSDTGAFAIRCYVQSEAPESPTDVLDDLLDPGIVDINHFKFRLFLAMQTSVERGSPVRDIYRFVRSNVSEERLRTIPSWSRAAVDGFELWKDADTVYTFPTLSEMRTVLGQYFIENATWFPSYTLGSHCPTLLLSKR